MKEIILGGLLAVLSIAVFLFGTVAVEIVAENAIATYVK